MRSNLLEWKAYFYHNAMYCMSSQRKINIVWALQCAYPSGYPNKNGRMISHMSGGAPYCWEAIHHGQTALQFSLNGISIEQSSTPVHLDTIYWIDKWVSLFEQMGKWSREIAVSFRFTFRSWWCGWSAWSQFTEHHAIL